MGLLDSVELGVWAVAPWVRRSWRNLRRESPARQRLQLPQNRHHPRSRHPCSSHGTSPMQGIMQCFRQFCRSRIGRADWRITLRTWIALALGVLLRGTRVQRRYQGGMYIVDYCYCEFSIQDWKTPFIQFYYLFPRSLIMNIIH